MHCFGYSPSLSSRYPSKEPSNKYRPLLRLYSNVRWQGIIIIIIICCIRNTTCTLGYVGATPSHNRIVNEDEIPKSRRIHQEPTLSNTIIYRVQYIHSIFFHNNAKCGPSFTSTLFLSFSFLFFLFLFFSCGLTWRKCMPPHFKSFSIERFCIR